jgi:hypothetical protein
MAKAGRPKIDVDDYFAKIISYLQLGYSLHKACLYAQVPYRQLHEYYEANEDFRNKVEATRGQLSIRARANLADVIMNKEVKDEKGNIIIPKKPQTMVNDISLQWLENIEKEDFSKRTEIKDVSERSEAVELLKKLIRQGEKEIHQDANKRNT